MRFQEAEADEEEYWQEHPWGRYKRKKMEWLRAKYNLDTSSLMGVKPLGAPEFFEKKRSEEMIAQMLENQIALAAYELQESIGTMGGGGDVDVEAVALAERARSQ